MINTGTPVFRARLKMENPGILAFALTIEDTHGAAETVLGRVFHELGASLNDREVPFSTWQQRARI
jgi:hypothetical protein